MMDTMTLNLDPWEKSLDARFFLGRMKDRVALAGGIVLFCALAVAFFWQAPPAPEAREMLLLCSFSFALAALLLAYALVAIGFYRQAHAVWEEMVQTYSPRWQPALVAQTPEFAVTKLHGLRGDMTVAALRTLSLKLKKLEVQWTRMVERRAALKARWDRVATMPYAWGGLFCPTAERQRLKGTFVGVAGYYRSELLHLHEDLRTLLEKRDALLKEAAA